MQKDPNIVVSSVTDAQTELEPTVNIYPLTIQRYCYLEMVDSPFVNANKKYELNGVIPSAFIMAHTPAELRKYNSKNIDALIHDAFDWADANLKLADVPELIKVIVKQISDINKAAPSGGGDSSNTDGAVKKK